ncbi:hypothetical protein EV401DRAFT_2074391 [Pisolithus croceorrhizus]|nr:hypothetical protein EV401DRAFT_2074391 [Pisolithus croceorrhizus]
MTVQQDMKQITKHNQYYIRDGNVVFVAEKQLFRVHRHFFERESEFFSHYFITSGEADGTDNKPFVLDVKSEDFAKFLWVWYNPQYRYGGQPKETWLAIITLATRWGFDSMRELAIRQLQRFPMSPVDRIALYKEYNIDKKLLIPSYVDLCKSPTLPSPADAQRLQLETVLRLADARERALLRAAENGCLSPTSSVLEDGELATIINDVFEMGGIGGEDRRHPSLPSVVRWKTHDWFFVDQFSSNGMNGTDCPTINPPKTKQGKASNDVFCIRLYLTLL